MKERDRRYMGLLVQVEHIARLISLDRGKTVRVLRSSIPKDAEFLSAYYDPKVCGLIMCFYHQSFNVVPQSCCIPMVVDTVFEFVEREKWVKYED